MLLSVAAHAQQAAPAEPSVMTAELTAPALPAVPRYAKPYQIGPGDEIAVTYPFNAELNHTGPVGPDGRITLPFIGVVTVAGKSPAEISTEISRDLLVAGIAQNAYPDVQVTKFGYANEIYVGGQVGKPGVVTMTHEMDTLEAIMAAGGLLDTARSGTVAIIHRMADNRPRVEYVDIHEYLKGKSFTPTPLLAPYDVVYVPKSKIAEVDTWVDNYINKTLPFSRGFGFNYNAGNNGAVVGTP